MKIEKYLKALKKLENKVYEDFSEFTRDLNYTERSIEKIFPVDNFETKTLESFYPSGILAKLQIKNKKYLIVLTAREKCPYH